MCGRFALKNPIKKLAATFGFTPTAFLFAPRYNIAPGQPILAVRQEAAGRKAAMLRWGLVPHWAKDPAQGPGLINARSETLLAKPAFRDAYRYRRCLIPADGFYEWQTQGKRKQPFYLHHADGSILALAGIWEHWQDVHGNELETCAIITIPSYGVGKSIHERMPAILAPEAWEKWLEFQTPVEQLTGLLVPAPKSILEAYPVGKEVNRPGFDDAACLKPVDTPHPPETLF